jgi:hypothetical protein
MFKSIFLFNSLPPIFQQQIQIIPQHIVDKQDIHTFSGTFIFTKKGCPDKMGCKGDRFAQFL